MLKLVSSTAQRHRIADEFIITKGSKVLSLCSLQTCERRMCDAA